MNFNEFTDSIVGLLKQKIGDSCTITVKEVLKNNDVRMTGIVITKGSDGISPTIYLDGFYAQYQDVDPLEKVAEEIMGLYKSHIPYVKLDMEFFKDFSLVESRIFHKVINHEMNLELLKDVPHFRWHDLAVVFYYSMDRVISGAASILIHNCHLDIWKQTAEKIYLIAQRNMKQKMPERLIPMQKLMDELREEGVETEETGLKLYVLTNREKLYGASAMLYSEKMKGLADRLGSDLLILPCSTHEVLLLPDDCDHDYEPYKKMVHAVNTTQVDPEEILSFNLYRYDRDKAEIEQIAV